MQALVCVQTCVCACVCVQTCVYMHVCVHACVCTCVCMCTCVWVVGRCRLYKNKGLTEFSSLTISSVVREVERRVSEGKKSLLYTPVPGPVLTYIPPTSTPSPTSPKRLHVQALPVTVPSSMAGHGEAGRTNSSTSVIVVADYKTPTRTIIQELYFIVQVKTVGRLHHPNRS